MKQNSDIERVGDILKTISFNFDEEAELKKEELMSKWGDIVEEKFRKYSKPVRIDDFGVMSIICKNSVVSNELFCKRTVINEKFRVFAKALGINFKYIKLTRGE